jgi:hypothetical protein
VPSPGSLGPLIVADKQSLARVFLYVNVSRRTHIVEQNLCYTGIMNTKDEQKTTSEKPVSLAPLNLEEALKGLLKVKPKAKPKKKPRKKQETKKSSD